MQRKNWTEYQDQILKYLKQDRKIKRWTDIAKIMNIQYKIGGRNGKQCRQRYHSHLQRVFPKRPWTRTEELELLQLHSQIGNKWSRIAQKMCDRSDNNIKNHFYSKLRRAARKVNKFISRIYYKQKRQIKFNDVYLIMEIFQAKFRGNCEWEDYQSDIAQELKNKLFILALDEDQTAEQQTQENINLAKQIVSFLEEIKKIHKRIRGKPRSNQDNLYSPDIKKNQRRSQSQLNINLQLQSKSSLLCEKRGQNRSEYNIKEGDLSEVNIQNGSYSYFKFNNILQTPKTEPPSLQLHSIGSTNSLNQFHSLNSEDQFNEEDQISELVLESSDTPEFLSSAKVVKKNGQRFFPKKEEKMRNSQQIQSIQKDSQVHTTHNLPASDNINSIECILQSIMSSSCSLQSFSSSERLFQWNQDNDSFKFSNQNHQNMNHRYENLLNLKSEQLQNIILLDYNPKQKMDGCFQFRSLLD